MKLRYSPTADALYIYFGRRRRSYGTEDISKGYSMRLVDYGKDGEPMGVEILGTKYGIDVRGLPREEDVAAVLRDHGFQLLSAEEQKQQYGVPPLRGVRPAGATVPGGA